MGPKDFSCGDCLLLGWFVCFLFTGTPPLEPSQWRVSQSGFTYLLRSSLITIWRENNHGAENRKGGWRWLSQTRLVEERARKRLRCLPGSWNSLCPDFWLHFHHVSHRQPSEAFPGGDECFNTGELWAFQEVAVAPGLSSDAGEGYGCCSWKRLRSRMWHWWQGVHWHGSLYHTLL